MPAVRHSMKGGPDVKYGKTGKGAILLKTGTRRSGYPIEKDPVEARQGFRGKPVLYVLIASLALLITAFIAIGTMIWVR